MNSNAINRIKDKLGAKGYRELPSDMAAYSRDWRGLREGKPRLVVLPQSVEEVSFVLNVCNGSNISIVPQGGNTGLCCASVTDASGSQILLSLQRMNKVRELDVDGNTACVEAGVILQNLHTLAEENNRYFPLSLGARGSCQIGGNVATNAGGINVLRYGNMRNLVLGLEVVLPDGAVLDNLSALRKDNTGYDLKQLFIGSEGTLGVITAASLKLFPLPQEFGTVFVGVNRIDDVIAFFSLCSGQAGDALCAFELISARALLAARNVLADKTLSLSDDYPWYVIAELSSPRANAGLSSQLEDLLTTALEVGLITDGIVAHSESQRAAIWLTRESITEGQGRSLRHDISVPISSIPAAAVALNEALAQVCEHVEPVIYGHVGDGNLHYNVVLPAAWEGDKYRQQSAAISEAIYAVTADFNGSFSAEHGVGTTKIRAFENYKDSSSKALMRNLKGMIDPANIMNPGVIFSTSS
ncbi:MAG: FAD-binding oxidoreductase [Pseudomonadales bacterium]